MISIWKWKCKPWWSKNSEGAAVLYSLQIHTVYALLQTSTETVSCMNIWVKMKCFYSVYNKSVLPILASQIHQYQISRENVSWLQHINHQSQLHTLSWFRLPVTHAIQGHMCFSIYTTLYVCTFSLILQCFPCCVHLLYTYIYNNILHWTSIYSFIGYTVRIAGAVYWLCYWT